MGVSVVEEVEESLKLSVNANHYFGASTPVCPCLKATSVLSYSTTSSYIRSLFRGA